MLATYRRRLAEKGVVLSRITTLKSSLSPLSEVQFNLPQLTSSTSSAGGSEELRPRETEGVELWGTGTQMDNWTASPTCLLAWRPTLSQIRAVGWQHGQAAHRGGSISLSLSDSAMRGRGQEANVASTGTMPGSHCCLSYPVVLWIPGIPPKDS